MHSCVYVIIENTDNIETAVTRALAPFDDARQVKPYKLRLFASTIMAMSRHYNIPESDHQRLSEKMRDWLGDPGGQDRLGLHALCSHNPDGKWDWYEIGGRFNGCIRGRWRPRSFAKKPDLQSNSLSSSILLRAKDFPKRTPFALVTPLGEWIERSSVVSTTSGWYVREVPKSAWSRRVRMILRKFPDQRIVCVDAHS